MAVALPADVCGVAGGNGTSCLDGCGVANGDGSSCATDDGFTDDGDDTFDLCTDMGAARAERQSVRLRAAASATTGLLGTYRLTLGGERTKKLSVFASENEIKAVLEALPVVGEGAITVVGLIGSDAMVTDTAHAT